MDYLEKKVADLYNNNIEENNINIENRNGEDYGNREALNEAMDYYNNIISKNGNNDNPVEIFEDVNNHVEDIRQDVLNNKNQNLK